LKRIPSKRTPERSLDEPLRIKDPVDAILKRIPGSRADDYKSLAARP